MKVIYQLVKEQFVMDQLVRIDTALASGLNPLTCVPTEYDTIVGGVYRVFPLYIYNACWNVTRSNDIVVKGM